MQDTVLHPLSAESKHTQKTRLRACHYRNLRMRDCFFRETQKCSVNGLPERTHLEDKGGFIRQKRGQKLVPVTLCRKGYKTYRLESNVALSLVLLLAR